MSSQPLQQPHNSPIFHTTQAAGKKRWVKWAIIGAVILAAVVIILVVANSDPNWKSISEDILRDKGYANAKIVNFEVNKGKNMFGWDVAVVEGEFTYGSSSTHHTFDITYRKMDGSWYEIFVTVDGETTF